MGLRADTDLLLARTLRFQCAQHYVPTLLILFASTRRYNATERSCLPHHPPPRAYRNYVAGVTGGDLNAQTRSKDDLLCLIPQQLLDSTSSLLLTLPDSQTYIQHVLLTASLTPFSAVSQSLALSRSLLEDSQHSDEIFQATRQATSSSHSIHAYRHSSPLL